jgi:hypothetical protein
MLGELLFKVYAQKEYALYIFVILTSLNLLFRSDCESWDRGGKGDDDVGALVSLKVQHSLCVTSLRLFRHSTLCHLIYCGDTPFAGQENRGE